MRSELAIYQALISIGIDEPRANAVVTALEHDMSEHLATKADLLLLENRLTIRMAVMLSAAVGIALTVAKFMFG